MNSSILGACVACGGWEIRQADVIADLPSDGKAVY